MASEKSEFAKQLGINLRVARARRSFQEIADNTGGFVHPRMIQNYEEGTDIRLSTFLVLAAALGYRAFELLPLGIPGASEQKDTAKLVSIIVNG